MKKIVTLLFVLFLSLSVNAQQKKSFDDAVKTLNLPKETVSKLQEVNTERNVKAKEIVAMKLNKEDQKTKMRELAKATYPKISGILGKAKTKEWSAYWRK
ncbi:hypothetical protein [Flavobacterium sp. 7A]|uniref:hypothetical protein n=1 Tax=Flavobacterium sp. 7A TaxID=2940571 RepID=UPI002227E0BB|nr:hypothetical protein [Flavobacterium sp. 7A]MCW2118850.1 seryl-tRNA synthetase [Flavobacterium sp. 7A]